MKELHRFNQNIQEKILEWLEGPYDAQTKKIIHELIEKNPEQLQDAFIKKLYFGTGGIRALMGVGCNRVNQYTIRAAAQGLANHIQKLHKHPKAVIGFDTRINSQFFAEETAKVFAGNGIQTFLFSMVSPTPLVSFTCRELKCHTAVMITASHNPPEYNGFKVFNENGAQVIAPEDQKIIEEVAKIQSPSQIKIDSTESKFFHRLDQTPYKNFIEKIQSLQKKEEFDQKYGREFPIIYTNLHGSGITLIPESLAKWGFAHVQFVETQLSLDGMFPHASPPNPEDKKVLKTGVHQMLKEKAKILIATDPDADRIGCVIRDANTVFYLNGNQIGCICLHFLLEIKKSSDLPFFSVKSIVTSELFQRISESFGVKCYNVLTGFKYIAEKIEQLKGKEEFIFGAEESYGYLPHLFSRDKDAVSMACILSEIALVLDKKKQTLKSYLFEIFKKYGIFFETLKSINLPDTEKSMLQMKQWMKTLRESSFSEIEGIPLIRFDDYLLQTIQKPGKVKESTCLPKSDVLGFWLEDGTKIMIRPSGTEPKIKIYIGVVTHKKTNLESHYEDLESKAHGLLKKIEQKICL